MIIIMQEESGTDERLAFFFPPRPSTSKNGIKGLIANQGCQNINCCFFFFGGSSWDVNSFSIMSRYILGIILSNRDLTIPPFLFLLPLYIHIWAYISRFFCHIKRLLILARHDYGRSSFQVLLNLHYILYVTNLVLLFSFVGHPSFLCHVSKP